MFYIVQFSLFGVLGAVFLPLFGWLKLRDYRDKRQGRRNPLTHGLLRVPGQALRLQIEDMQTDLVGYILIWPLSGIAIVTAQCAAYYISHKQFSTFIIGFWCIFLLGLVGWSIIKAVLCLNKIKTSRLGLQGELASAEELNKLMRHGYEIFYDLPADNFNVDHVVVGPSGVYAVETKARTKRMRAGGGWRATFDGRWIDFEGYQTDQPLQQAARQAKWLGRWLTQASGEQVKPTPVVALPGWMVNRCARGDVSVINPREVEQLVRGKPAILDAKQISRITHQLEQRCREPLTKR